jgi:signal transduction histidine kinase
MRPLLASLTVSIESYNFKRKLLLAFLWIGLFNVLVLSTFVYVRSRAHVIERSKNHMVSVANLAGSKLHLYLKNLKLHYLNDKRIDVPVPELEASCQYINQKPKVIKGIYCPEWKSIETLPSEEFVFYGTDQNFFLLKSLPHVWIFNHQGMSDLLMTRDGLGNSGEIYLVGADYKTKSASRFIKDWQNIVVQNESVKKGLSNKEGVTIVKDYRNIDVISGYMPFTFDQLKFVILSEIDQDEVLAPINVLRYNLILISGVLFIFSSLMAIPLTTSTLRLIRKMEHEIQNLNAQMGRQILMAQEKEREKIAYNLHDSAGQYMTALKWELSRLREDITVPDIKDKLTELTSLSDKLIKEMRSISQDIMPSLIKDFGCFPAIRDYLKQQERLFNFRIQQFYSTELETIKWKHAFQINLFRMIQELIQNAVKHSNAQEIMISFRKSGNELILEYKDDGEGTSDHVALPKSLLYRTKLFQGKMKQIESKNGFNLVFEFSFQEVADGTN